MRTRSVSKAERDELILANLPLVKGIAARVREGLPVHVDLDDLVHAGILGLMDAASKYDPDQKVVFATYAKHRIRGAMIDSLRKADFASRDLRRRQKMVEELNRELGHPASEAEIAERLGVTVARWRQMALELKNAGLFGGSSDVDPASIAEYPDHREAEPDRLCAQQQMRGALNTAIGVLPERYRKVVILYYTKEMTMKEIGETLGVNESRVSQIHKTALERLATALHSAGIHSAMAF